MEKDLSNLRLVYSQGELLEKDLKENPMEQFQQWFFQTQQSNTEREPNAMSVSTIGLDGFPKTRIVLLKKYTDEGFIFYTNYNSEKGKAIIANPNICLSFFWPVLERQIIIKGVAEKLAENLSNGYFESRPRGSQLGSIISAQSEVIPSREYLQEKLNSLEKEMEGKPLKRPTHWGGFLVRPISLEFWQGRPNRLHDRVRYTLEEDYDWKIERLSP
ncbi:pyridoxamine 5'-phosphate oxidase [Capnocytophaga sp. oral taxon 338]|jgi:pyridoxamine-phosphate oxidase|uniref:pyridoxamine 5'-phosphate oxidase n=1 Tax=Capnocytophaga sp. oral taxon 338 TaxID=710239 RepID=UPI000202F4D0|nr:pyridoxamine 5'-phosphate oxidase [Capnocytophaga sp. oral taxon 338]EGD34306.1 pyridoxamine 5'-phosphate oxidase [Capnocytophaga sp. oral taxon 338 str. F0234]